MTSEEAEIESDSEIGRFPSFSIARPVVGFPIHSYHGLSIYDDLCSLGKMRQTCHSLHSLFWSVEYMQTKISIGFPLEFHFLKNNITVPHVKQITSVCNFVINPSTPELLEFSPWRVKSSGVRQSKIYKVEICRVQESKG